MASSFTMDCVHCNARVPAPVIAAYETEPSDDDREHIVYFLKCSLCGFPMVASTPADEPDDPPYRMFPAQEGRLSSAVPSTIRSSHEEAWRCFKAKAYTAAAIMCGKSLESMCRAHKVKELEQLRESGVIEDRLLEWGEAVQATRDQAAHDLSTAISRQDSEDLIQFTEAILEYVFTFADRFGRFRDRRSPASTRRVRHKAKKP